MTHPIRLLLLGGGGHAAVVADAGRGAGMRIAGFVDDAESVDIRAAASGLEHLGTLDDLDRLMGEQLPGTVVHAAVGDAAIRQRWLDAAGDWDTPAIVHPDAIISPGAEIDDGAFVGPGAIVNARAHIGRGAIVNSGAIIEHDCVVGAFAHIAPGAVLAGDAHVGDGALVGVGASVLPGIHIGDGATLGGGSVATNNIAAGVTAVGVPARAFAVDRS